MTDPALFALAVLALLATPGPTNTLLATAGAAGGFRRALWLVPAETAGYLLAITLIAALLGPVVAGAPLFALTLRLLVGVYLLHVAWTLWRGAARRPGDGLVTPIRVFVTTLLNPKAIVFALGIIPMESPKGWLYLAAFAGLTACVALGWISFGALLGRAAGGKGHGALVPRIGAAVVGAFGVMLMSGPLLR